MEKPAVGVVILAAGESSRMGEQKLLLPLMGTPLLEHVVNSFREITERIVVVLGHKPEIIAPLLQKLHVKWVVNEEYQHGMITSFKRGLAELRGCDAVFLALGDQPLVDKDFLLKAIASWEEGAKIVCPIFRGKKGHPVLFDQSLFEEILSLGKNQFIRDVIHRHAGFMKLIEAGEWAITDVDTPEDFLKLKKQMGTV
ncbi:MAG: NTP transferase domain-containing protein [Candidatus Hadarchaeales archaeon]